MIERIIAYPASGGDLGSEEWRATVAETREYIVRCRDCKHARHYRPYSYKGKRSTIEEWYCEWHSNPEGASEIEPDGFCAWGERRDG